MIAELIKELRSYPEHYTAAHRAADALENSEKNRLAMHYYACRLEDDLVKLEAAAESLREHIAEQQLDIVTLGQEVGRLREVLRPLATLYLYPDDLGFEEAADIREDPDWDEDANDMQTDDQFILRKHIRAARDLVGGRDG
jgi:hypothetical protein